MTRTPHRVCSHPDCVTISPGPRCPAHQRGTTTQRGYGPQHVALRARWAPHVATGTVTCWRCGNTIQPNEPWDLGHEGGQHAGPEHANRCNRSTAGQQAHR